MNTYIKILLGTCCSFSILSCSNNLDETVYSKVTEQTYNYTVDDFTPSIASVYSYLRSQSDHWGYFCAQEVSADAIVMPPNASGWDDGGAYRRMHYQTWNSEQDHVKNIWSWFYQGALLCNKIIEQIETGVIPTPSDTEKTQGLAELRAMRAYIIRKTKCFDFWERNVLFPKTKRSFFRTPKHPLPCPFPLNFSLLIITKKFGNLAKNRYICIV